jgi:hypothetical protein
MYRVPCTYHFGYSVHINGQYIIANSENNSLNICHLTSTNPCKTVLQIYSPSFDDIVDTFHFSIYEQLHVTITLDIHRPEHHTTVWLGLSDTPRQADRLSLLQCTCFMINVHARIMHSTVAAMSMLFNTYIHSCRTGCRCMLWY